MKTFLQLLWFEIRNRLWRWSSLVYFLIYFALSFLLSVSFAGAFKGVSVSFGLSNKLALNSPLVINYMTALLGYLALLVVAPIFGQAVFKDYENGFYQIVFATPLRKRTYFWVRYLGAFLSLVAISSSFGLGLWLATKMPFIDATLVSQDHLAFYIQPYLTLVWPNFLIFGAIYFSLVTYSKRMAPVYVASVAVFTGWMISQSLTADLENKFLAAMIDPIGLEAASQVVRYWSIAQQSGQVVALTGVLLWNRLLWSGVGFVFLLLSYLLFHPAQARREKKVTAKEGETAAVELPKVSLHPFSGRVLYGLTKSEFRQAFSNIYFLMILLCGLLYIFAISSQIGKMFGTETLPVTYHVLEIVGGTFNLFVVIIIAYFSGELVWKDRDQKFAELVDSKPVPNAYLYLSKLFSLFMLQIFLAAIIVVCGVLIQLFKGYTNFELGLYIETLFFYGLPSRLLVCVLALFLHTVSPSKYMAHAAIVLYYLGLVWLPALGYDHLLYLVGFIPRWQYSDMNGFGESLYTFAVMTAYWSFFYLILAVVTVLLWRRGLSRSWRENLRAVHVWSIALGCIGFVAMGGFVFYNTNVLNPYRTKQDDEREQVEYEKTYKSFADVAQPKLISVKLKADIFPSTQGLNQTGVLIYENQSPEAISDLLLFIPRRARVTIEFNRPAQVKKDDPAHESRIYHLQTPLKPGEKLELTYNSEVRRRGFPNTESDHKINRNGTFYYGGDYGPMMGYEPGFEISEDKTRRKYKLPERPRMPPIDSVKDRQITYISSEGTWIDFEATVSTEPDQIAIAPGELLEEKLEGGRRHFHYKMERPMLNFYAILSGRYTVTRDQWKDVRIEVFHHQAHTKNVARMIEAVKKSLDYYTTNFSPYQFHQFRILEFPRYATFAQAFPNTVPYSEGVGFIAHYNPQDPESVDYPFYITAHEMAHQWWAHQVIGANVQGATMLSESLAQYSALMVQEHEWGAKAMKRYLKYELDGYLAGRSRETKKELPLALNENQMYIHYQKGSLVFYALKDVLGEATVNHVLAQYLHDFAYQQAPFTISRDLVERFRKAAPADKKYLVDDLFESITLYDNHTLEATVEPVGSKFKVTVTSDNKKLRADGLGRESEVPMNDWIDVGVQDEKGDYLYLQKHQVHSGHNRFEVEVDAKPAKAGVDPINKLIDRISDDNVVRITPTPEKKD